VTVLTESDVSDVRGLHAEKLRDAIAKLQHDAPSDTLREPAAFTEIPNRSQWQKLIDRALAHIESEQFAKVVLGRRKRLRFPTKIDTAALIEQFFAKRDASYLFAIDDGEQLLLGRSPERLLRWHGDELALDTIAGTRPRLHDAVADRAMSHDLLHAEKDIQEHELVASEVSERLTQLCQSFKRVAMRQLLSLDYVHHLYSAFVGQLKPGLHAFDALRSLLPTAAVGGYPRAQSIAFINEQEPERRGYFCGAVGFGLGDVGEAAITIRTGIVRDNQLELFAGAGIVRGSEAEAEWDETEQKMQPFLRLFGRLGTKTDLRPRFGRSDVAEVAP
jgi:menaquinone-specific isochorismate synthase